MSAPPSNGSGLGPGLLRVACFAILGGLTGRRIAPEPAAIAAGSLVAVLLGAVGLAMLRRALCVLSPGARAAQGHAGVQGAVGRGFVMLLPFAVLALVAETMLGWNAVQSFAAAGVMTSAAVTASGVRELGGGRVVSLVVPSAWAMAFATVWMILSSVAATWVAS